MRLIPRCTWGSFAVALLLPTWTFAQTSQPVAALSAAPSSIAPQTTPQAAPVVETATSAQPSPSAERRQPAESLTWQDVVSNLSQRLSTSDLPALLKSLRPSPPLIRSFSSEAAQPPERLLAITSRSKVLGVHAYSKPPVTLAADIAEDFRNAADVPESVSRDMIPADETAEKRANDTAAAWLAQVLLPDKKQPVAVIILWPSDRRPGHESLPRRPIFVLIKAKSEDGAFILQQISYGDPLDTPR